MSWFRKPAGEPLSVAMPGIKLGDRLLVVGCSDTRMIAALAIKAGLTGRACLIDADQTATARAAAVVEREGALVESASAPYGSLPYGPGEFDVVLIRNVLATIPPGARSALAREAHRVLRPGGRCVVIDDQARGLLAAITGSGSRSHDEDASAERIVGAAGFKGVRTLAEREGLSFVEGVKAAH